MRQFLMLSTLILVTTITLIPAMAVEICSDGASTVLEGPSATVGNFANGNEQYAAQTFTLDCTAQILSMGFTLVLGTTMNGGTPPLTVGDTVQCEIHDITLDETIMTEAIVLDSGTNTQYLEFDFSGHEFELDVGQYMCVVSFPQESWGWVKQGSAYEGGDGYFHINGSLVPLDADYMFVAQWNSESGYVFTTATPWGALKATYR